MIENQRPVTPTNTGRNVVSHRSNQRVATPHLPRNILIGLGFAFLLACVEGALWLFNPFHLFGSAAPQNLPILLSHFVHTPLLWLVLLLQVIALCVLVQFADKPLALRRYLKEVQKAQEQYRALYTPLTSWPAIYERSVIRYQDTPDLSTPGQVQHMSMLELVQDLRSASPDSQSHQLILGPSGAGKTTFLYFYQFSVLQRTRPLIFGRDKIPVYIPLRNYSLYLQNHDTMSFQDEQVVGVPSLLDFLHASDLVGLHHLRPFLQQLAAQGRILFLCDGFNEIDEQYRVAVTGELAKMMGQHQNQLVLTCREIDFQEQPRLTQAVAENLVGRVYINPLDDLQMRSFVERFIQEQGEGKKWRHTAGQVMEVIDRSRLRDHCTNPLMFFALIEIIDDLGVVRGRQLDTRGLLLRAFVKHLIQSEMSQPRWSNAALTEHDVELFLSELACAASWANNTSAIQIPVSSKRG